MVSTTVNLLQKKVVSGLVSKYVWIGLIKECFFHKMAIKRWFHANGIWCMDTGGGKFAVFKAPYYKPLPEQYAKSCVSNSILLLGCVQTCLQRLGESVFEIIGIIWKFLLCYFFFFRVYSFVSSYLLFLVGIYKRSELNGCKHDTGLDWKRVLHALSRSRSQDTSM